ncbi:hypothetical protein V8G54_031619 [Vigna mungo]|uniref:Uncharacterized protein n=1 Tax=Vigna mungo TaxID=3915 RepID=A0AAQ3RFZ1_VIGMU
MQRNGKTIQIHETNLSMASEERPDSSVDVKHPNVPLFQPIAYIGLIHRNLPPQNGVRIRPIFRDRSNFQLRLDLARQPDVHVVGYALPGEMPSLGDLAAGEPSEGCGGGSGGGEDGRGGGGGCREVRGRGGGVAKEGHEASAGVRVGRRRDGLRGEGEGTVVVEREVEGRKGEGCGGGEGRRILG